MPPGGLVACRSTGRLPRLPAGRGPTRWPRRVRRTAWPWRWLSSAARVHVVVVSVLILAETLVAARRLAGARPHLAAVAGIVHHQDLWQRCRDELTGVDVRTMERFRNPATRDGEQVQEVDYHLFAPGPGRLSRHARTRRLPRAPAVQLPGSHPGDLAGGRRRSEYNQRKIGQGATYVAQVDVQLCMLWIAVSCSGPRWRLFLLMTNRGGVMEASVFLRSVPPAVRSGGR